MWPERLVPNTTVHTCSLIANFNYYYIYDGSESIGRYVANQNHKHFNHYLSLHIQIVR